ncbi:hypothetical protein KGQ31_00505 [Patescibacteria group bacterium]|nr:hypothetical protein [Patescibacteria group bacterium]
MLVPKDGSRLGLPKPSSEIEKMLFAGIGVLFAVLFWQVFTQCNDGAATDIARDNSQLTAASYQYSNSASNDASSSYIIPTQEYYYGTAPKPVYEGALPRPVPTVPFYYYSGAASTSAATSTSSTTTSPYRPNSATAPTSRPTNPTSNWYMPGVKNAVPSVAAAQAPTPPPTYSAGNNRGFVQRVKDIWNIAYKFFFGGAPADAPPSQPETSDYSGNNPSTSGAPQTTGVGTKTHAPKDAGLSCIAAGNCHIMPYLDLTHYDSSSAVNYNCGDGPGCSLGGSEWVPTGSGILFQDKQNWDRKPLLPDPKNLGGLSNTKTESDEMTQSGSILDEYSPDNTGVGGPKVTDYNYDGQSGKGTTRVTDRNWDGTVTDNTTETDSENFNPSTGLSGSLTGDSIGPATGAGSDSEPAVSGDNLSTTYTSTTRSAAGLVFLNGDPSLTYSVPLLVKARQLKVSPNYNQVVVSRVGDNIPCSQITVAGVTASDTSDNQCLVTVTGAGGGAVVDVTPSIPSIPFYEYNLSLDYSPPPLLSAVIKAPRNVKFSIIYPAPWAEPPLPVTQYFKVERAVGSGDFAFLKNIYPADAILNAAKYADEITDNLDITLPTPSQKLSYRVRALTKTGWSDWSNVVTIQSPTDLTAKMPDPLKGSDPTNGDPVKVKLNWTDNTPGKENGFQIERAVDAENSVFQAVGKTKANAVSASDDLSAVTSISSPQIAYRVRAVLPDGTFSDNTNVASVSSCVHISGSGPRKVVFTKGDGWNVNVNDYLSQVNDIINNGFKSIDPFKTYINQFSFYADLEQIDQSKLTDRENHFASGEPVVNSSSCGKDATEYFFLFDNNSYVSSWTDIATNPPVVFFNVPEVLKLTSDPNFNTENPIPAVAMHETGHALGHLNDEYIYAKAGTPFSGYDLIGDLSYAGLTEENCTLNPASLYTYNDGTGLKWYGDANHQGCSFSLHPNDYSSYYRPSDASIMNSGSHSDKFNVISCGYLISAIKNEPVDKAHAQTHWPECTNLDTVKPSILAKIVTVGSIGTSMNGPFSGIFSWIDKIAPDSIRIPSGVHSIAYLTKKLRQTIDDQLAAGNKVLVIGHSLGAYVAFNVKDDFQGKPVQFIYLDPPYNFLSGKKCFSILGGIFARMYDANCHGIATDSDTVKWTNGNAIGLFFSNFKYHDPIDFQNAPGTAPNGKTNVQNLIDLTSYINKRLSSDFICGRGGCSSTVVPTGTLATAPVITGVSASFNGAPVNSIQPGDTITITGSGFDMSANNIEVVNTANSDVSYDLYDVQPDQENTNKLSFVLPSVPDYYPATVRGTYTIKVSAVDSDWSSPVNITIKAGGKSRTPLPANTNTN